MINPKTENTLFFFKGRVALYALLKAMGIARDDEIIIPGYTCVVVPNAITYLGAHPVYIDIDPNTYNIDPEKIEADKGRNWEIGKAKVLIAQHTYGIPDDMDKISQTAKKYNLHVIEDSCHAVGSLYKGKEVGLFGDAAFFSSQWSKPLTTGIGGWGVINNPKLKENMEKIHSEFIQPSLKEAMLIRLQYLAFKHFFKPSTFWFAQNTYRTLSRLGIALGSSSNEELECRMPVGYEKKMSGWQRNLLEKELNSIHRYIEHRKWVSSMYEELLKRKGIKTVELAEYYEPVFLRYPIFVKNKRKVLEEAKKKRVEIGDWFLSPVHPNLNGWEKVGYKKGMCPIAENICQHIINLPTHMRIREKEVREIIDFLDDRV
jgi:perosamine synthetase